MNNNSAYENRSNPTNLNFSYNNNSCTNATNNNISNNINNSYNIINH